MAKKKPVPEPEPVLYAAERRVTVINLKGNPELRDWLSGISEKTMIPAAAITRAALKLWAKENGHPAPPA
jgi:hypothetical protein